MLSTSRTWASRLCGTRHPCRWDYCARTPLRLPGTLLRHACSPLSRTVSKSWMVILLARIWRRWRSSLRCGGRAVRVLCWACRTPRRWSRTAGGGTSVKEEHWMRVNCETRLRCRCGWKGSLRWSGRRHRSTTARLGTCLFGLVGINLGKRVNGWAN